MLLYNKTLLIKYINYSMLIYARKAGFTYTESMGVKLYAVACSKVK